VIVTIAIRDEFGSHLADGSASASFRVGRIDPYVDISSEIILDFTGVRNANSSFINALVAGLVEQHGMKVLQKTVFKGCIPPIRVLIEAAVDLGVTKINGRVNA
jgi:hypothetical protein